jgi:hypothetical protein
VIGSPLVVSGITIEHVIGHIFWGAVIGLGTLSIRYIILGGSFALCLDADHLLQFLDIELVSRMSHSIPFAILVSMIFFLILKGRDLKIAAVAFAAILSHIAFDMFLAEMMFLNSGGSTAEFPLFSPFQLDAITLQGGDWIFFEIIGVIIVIVMSYISKRREIVIRDDPTKT